MPDEDTPLRTIPADRTPLSAVDPRDDWLSDANELDWFDEDEAGSREGQRPGLGRRARRTRPAGPPRERSLQQRRLVAVGVLLAIVVVAIVVIVLASGGGSKAPTPPVVTTPVTTPATTGKTTTGSKTTPKTPKTTALKVTVPASGALKNGDTGTAVATLQRALTKLGATGIKADGNFGAKTQDAVTAFQTQHKLTADGVVGSKTAQAINTALAQLGG